MFESMYESEQKIRLGEAGWKARYYEVQPCLRLLVCIADSTCARALLCTNWSKRSALAGMACRHATRCSSA